VTERIRGLDDLPSPIEPEVVSPPCLTKHEVSQSQQLAELCLGPGWMSRCESIGHVRADRVCLPPLKELCATAGKLGVADKRITKTKPSISEQTPGGISINRPPKFRKVAVITKPGTRVPCTYCAATFSQRCHMLCHVRTVHQAVKNYRCHLCDSRFARRAYLREHVTVVHNKKREHSCPQCGSKFGWKSEIAAHLKIAHGAQRKSSTPCLNALSILPAFNTPHHYDYRA